LASWRRHRLHQELNKRFFTSMVHLGELCYMLFVLVYFICCVVELDDACLCDIHSQTGMQLCLRRRERSPVWSTVRIIWWTVEISAIFNMYSGVEQIICYEWCSHQLVCLIYPDDHSHYVRCYKLSSTTSKPLFVVPNWLLDQSSSSRTQLTYCST